MRRRSIVSPLAAAHFIASMVLAFVAFALNMDRFDGGAPPSRAERVIEACGPVLLFPVVTVALHSGVGFPGLLGYLPVLLNSLLWGFAASALFGLMRKRAVCSVAARRGSPPPISR